MGRDIKRVAAGFDWPRGVPWHGYLCPYRSTQCPHDHHPHAMCSGRSGGTAYRCGCVCSQPARAR